MKKNIVIFYTDDQGTVDAGCYGSDDLKTPALDKLAKEGVRFTQAYAHSVCCPSRAALLTGRYPQRGGVNHWMSNRADFDHQGNMYKDEITIAQVLKNKGYKTAMFGKWHLGAKEGHRPNDFGFDEFFGIRCGFIENYEHKFMHDVPFHDLYENEEEIFRDGEYFPDMVTDRAKKFLEENTENGFFLYLPYNLPHFPYQADMKYVDEYNHLPMPRSKYAPVVATIDDRIGQVMDKIDELGLREDTLIIYMSDNGHDASWFEDKEGRQYGPWGGGGSAGEWTGYKMTFYEGGIRVPCIMSMPGVVPKGEVRDQLITNMDFMPTICNFLEIPLPQVKLDGYDIWDIIKSDDAISRYDNKLYYQFEKNWMVRDGDWKLLSGNWNKLSASKEIELVNLNDEKPETINHAKEHPEIVDKMLKMHRDWYYDVFNDSCYYTSKRGLDYRNGDNDRQKI